MISDDVQKAIVTAVTTAVPLMFLYWLQHRAVLKKVAEVKTEVLGKVGDVDKKVGDIEKHTNSMKDALVKAAHGAGVSEQREKQVDIDKAVAAATAQPVASPTSSKGLPVKLDRAIEQLTDAAQETVESAEKTVEHAEKIPRKT